MEVGIVWFDETQSAKLKEVAADPERLVDAHEAWQRTVTLALAKEEDDARTKQLLRTLGPLRLSIVNGYWASEFTSYSTCRTRRSRLSLCRRSPTPANGSRCPGAG
jgi:hypothetical protein